MWEWYTGGASKSLSSLAIFLTLREQGVIVFGHSGQIFVRFHTGRQEKWGGNTSRKWWLCSQICFIVFQRSCCLVCWNNTLHKDASDLIIALNSPSLFCCPVTKTGEMCKLQRHREAFKNPLATESLTFITWLIPKWATGFGLNWWVMKWNDAENVAGYLSHMYPSVTIDCV